MQRESLAPTMPGLRLGASTRRTSAKLPAPVPREWSSCARFAMRPIPLPPQASFAAHWAPRNAPISLLAMASRERKRAERRKRKQRSTQRPPGENGQVSRERTVAARSEAKNQAVREKLEPLEHGERPPVVTIGAVVSALIAISSVIGYLAGVEVTRFGSDGIEQGEGEAPITSIIAVVALMGTMAYGMWKARYWAVLGFQALAGDRARGGLTRPRTGDRLEACGRNHCADRRGGGDVLLHDQGDGAHPDARAPARGITSRRLFGGARRAVL